MAFQGHKFVRQAATAPSSPGARLQAHSQQRQEDTQDSQPGQEGQVMHESSADYVTSAQQGRISKEGWLFKKCGRGPHPKWRKQWFYMVEDRLCYLVEPEDGQLGPAAGPGQHVRYIALDRVPVRPIPIRRKRVNPHELTPPDMGVQLLPTYTMKGSLSDGPAVRSSLLQMPGRAPGHVFTIVSGSHTHFLAAETTEEAEDWVAAIRRSWLHCFRHTLRGTDGRVQMDGLATTIHAAQRLRAENSELRSSIANLEERMAATDTKFWRQWMEEVAKNQQLTHAAKNHTVYEVETKTGSGKGAGTDARVYVELHGKGGSSGEHQLRYTETDEKPFGRGKVDHFEVACPNLGLLEKLRVSHDNTGRYPDWFLEEARIRKKGDKQWTYFTCNRWLSATRDDARISRELLPGQAQQNIPYNVSVVTSDLRGAGTDANVFVILHGTAGSGRRHHLTCGPEDFERGMTNNFVVEEADLGDLAAITIGHDGSGAGASWHMDHVVVENSRTRRRFLFPCRQWFDSNLGDGLLERTLQAAGAMGEDTSYLVAVTTGDVRGAGTDADVFITLHGSAGDSPRIKLPSRQEHLERGQRDVFRIQSPDVGEIKKITIGHNNAGDAPAWFLDLVEVAPETDPGRVTYFACYRWLALTLDDGMIERTLTASSQDPRTAWADYKVDFYTSDIRGAGTDANVSFVLYGKGADSGVVNVSAALEAFERGKMDSFKYKLKYLGALERMVLSHDSAGEAPAWHLDKVVVTCAKDGKAVVFPCSSWVRSENGKPARVELLAGTQLGAAQRQYVVAVKTSDLKGAATDCRVAVELLGDNGARLGPLVLENAANNFERGQVDMFKLEGPDIGRIAMLRVTAEPRGVRQAWHLDSVRVGSSVQGAQEGDLGAFTCNAWLDARAGFTRELKVAAAGQLSNQPRKHVIKVKTGDVKAASTDADVDIQLVGEAGPSGWQRLLASHNTFERGQEDTFELVLPPLGKLRSLIVRSAGNGPSPNWYLDMVTVIVPDVSPQHVFFPAGRWLDKQHGLQAELQAVYQDPAAAIVMYQLEVITSDIKGAGTDANIQLEFVGEKESSGKVKLETLREHLERGQTDLFTLRARNVGPLRALHVYTDAAGMGGPWHLDMITVTTPTGDRFFFPYGAWLDKQHPHAEIRASTKDPRTNKRMYKVITHTSNLRGAGTDANVFVELRGDMGSSKRELLRNSKFNCFERGQTDEFEVTTAAVGAITEVVVGHDGAGLLPAWHLESMEVIDSVTGMVYYLECNDWLKGKAAEIVLKASLQDPKLLVRKYKVVTQTGTDRGAGTDANVSVDLRGEAGSSGRLMLRNSSFNCFERGQTDEFEVACKALGPLRELLIGHDGSGLGAAWQLAHVVVTDPGTGEALFFNCGEWLDAKNGTAEKLLKPSMQDPRSLQVQYKIAVQTSDLKGASTDANVFIQLHGDRGSTPKLTLDNKGHNDFQRGKRDEFTVTCKDVGPLRKIRIGHDNTGIGGAWHLDHVAVSGGSLGGQAVIFPCKKWLSKSEGDGQLERDLFPADALPPEVTYEVTTITSNLRGAGTDANVSLVLYGKEPGKEAGPFRLDNGRNAFEKGQTDVFKVVGHDIGELARIKIWHDNKGLGGAWHLETVTITNSAMTGKKWWCYCNQWLSTEHGIERTLEASPKDPRDSLLAYKVITHTSNLRGAGTDANVFVDIVGTSGRSGKQELRCPGKNLFEKAQTDEFVLKLQDLGELKELTVGHDGSGLGAGWHLDFIEVHTPLNKVYYFQCGQWLDSSQGDRQTMRTLRGSLADPRGQKARYRVVTVTSDIRGAGTDANVWVEIRGVDGTTGRKLLEAKGKNLFERGQTDNFEFEAHSVGRIGKVLIGHDNAGLGPGWHLKSLEVENLASGEKLFFQVDRWFDKKNDDGAIERELTPEGAPGIPGRMDWKVIVVTGKKFGAGTDADVFIQIKGSQGSFGPHQLAAKKAAFDAGCRDEFSIETDEIGAPMEVTMSHNNKGMGGAWLLESVELVNKRTGSSYMFKYNCWLDTKNGLSKTARVAGAGDDIAAGVTCSYRIDITASDRPEGALQGADLEVGISGDGGETGPCPLASRVSFTPGQTQRFTLDSQPNVGAMRQLQLTYWGAARSQWLPQLVTVLNETTGAEGSFPVAAPLHEGEPSTAAAKELVKCDYKVEVQTSNIFGAGTDANVHLNIIGADGQTERQKLVAASWMKNLFERNQLDTFVLKNMPDVGPMQRIVIGHDGKGFGAGWHLAWVRVTNLRTNETATFQANRWLDKGKEDGKLECSLAVTESKPGNIGAMPDTIQHDSVKSVSTAAHGTASAAAQKAFVGDATVTVTNTGVIAKKLRAVGDPGYKVTFKTSNICCAGTNSQVSFELIGQNGSTGMVTPAAKRGQFARGHLDSFVFQQLPYVGDLHQLVVKTDGHGMFAAWHLRTVEVEHLSSGERWLFRCHCWLDKKCSWQRVIAGEPAEAGLS